MPFSSGACADHSTGFFRRPAASLDDVKPDDVHSRCDEESYGELPNKPEPDHAGCLTQGNFSAPNPLHRNRTDSRERGMLSRNAVRYGGRTDW
jgi:hypothetical protein